MRWRCRRTGLGRLDLILDRVVALSRSS